MGQSNLPERDEPKDRDTGTLAPSDSSDSGSDMTGLAGDLATTDPAEGEGEDDEGEHAAVRAGTLPAGTP